MHSAGYVQVREAVGEKAKVQLSCAVRLSEKLVQELRVLVGEMKEQIQALRIIGRGLMYEKNTKTQYNSAGDGAR